MLGFTSNVNDALIQAVPKTLRKLQQRKSSRGQTCYDLPNPQMAMTMPCAT